MASYNNYRDVIALFNARKALNQMGEEFTSKEFNAVRPKYTRPLKTLRKLGIVSVVKVETFEKEVEVPYYRRGRTVQQLVADNGRVVSTDDLTPYLYFRLPKEAQKALDKAYNFGNPMRMQEVAVGDTEVITVKRYFYHFNPEVFEKVYATEVKRFDKVVEKKRKAVDEATRTFNRYYELLCKL